MPVPVRPETCSRCGTVWTPPDPPNAWRDILFRKSSRISLEEYLEVKCPQCGNTQVAENRRFFLGRVGPRTVRYLVVGIVVAVLIALAIVLYRDLG